MSSGPNEWGTEDMRTTTCVHSLSGTGPTPGCVACDRVLRRRTPKHTGINGPWATWPLTDHPGTDHSQPSQTDATAISTSPTTATPKAVQPMMRTPVARQSLLEAGPILLPTIHARKIGTATIPPPIASCLPSTNTELLASTNTVPSICNASPSPYPTAQTQARQLQCQPWPYPPGKSH